MVASQEEGPRAFPFLLGFSLMSKDMHVKLTRYSKMAIVMNVSASKSVKHNPEDFKMYYSACITMVRTVTS